MAEVIRSLSIKFMPPTKRKKELLLLTMRRYRKCANYHIEMMKEIGTTDKRVLHKRFYESCKETYKLPACIVQVARDKAVESYRAHLSNGGGFPRLRRSSLRLNRNTFRVFERGDRWFAGILTVSGRIYVPIIASGPIWQEAEKKLESIKGGEIVHRNGAFYLNLFIKQKVEVMRTEEAEHIVAVDRGVNNIATVVVTNRSGKVVHAKFFSGSRHGWKRKHNYEVRKSLQTGKKLEKVRELKDKEQRYMRDIDHKISREIVETARKFTKPLIVLENLKNIRVKVKYSKRQNRRIHNWSFNRIGSFITYKAHSHGIPMLDAWAAYTTRYHSHCGSMDTVRDGSILRCKCCGYVVNADFNGAYNLSLRGWRMLGYMPSIAGCRESSPERLHVEDVLLRHQSDLRSFTPSGVE